MTSEVFPVSGSDELYGEVFLHGGETSVKHMVKHVRKGATTLVAARYAIELIPVHSMSTYKMWLSELERLHNSSDDTTL